MGLGVKKVEDNEIETVIVQRRSLRATSDFKAGHIIVEGDFVPLRPCPKDAISPAESQAIIGRQLSLDFIKGNYVRACDLIQK